MISLRKIICYSFHQASWQRVDLGLRAAYETVKCDRCGKHWYRYHIKPLQMVSGWRGIKDEKGTQNDD